MGILSKFFNKKKQVSAGDFADVSHWEKVNFSLYDKDILITKCTESLSIFDPTYDQIKINCKAKGIKFGAYHFFRCNKPVIEQAEFFLKKAGLDCDYYILDFESLDGSSPSVAKQFVLPFLKYVEEKTGKLPFFYSGHAFIVSLNLDKEVAKYPLWLARYTTIRPQAPAPWDKWTWWQFSDKAFFNGIGECDGNVINKD